MELENNQIWVMVVMESNRLRCKTHDWLNISHLTPFNVKVKGNSLPAFAKSNGKFEILSKWKQTTLKLVILLNEIYNTIWQHILNRHDTVQLEEALVDNP